MVEIDSDSTKGELEQIYSLLEVDLIDVVEHEGMSIYVDDEGLLKADPKPTLKLNDTQQTLYGNILILGDVDENGETMGVSEENISCFGTSRLFQNRFTGMQMLVW